MTTAGTDPRPEDRFDHYLRKRDVSGHYFDWQVEQFRPFLGRRIADVGCGPGTMTPLLAASRELYLGVDLDLQLLAALRQAYGGVPSIQVFSGDITTEACRNRLLAESPSTDTCACSCRRFPRCTERSMPSTDTAGGTRKRWCAIGSSNLVRRISV